MPRWPLFPSRPAALLMGTGMTLAAALAGCGSSKDGGDACTPNDVDGIIAQPVTSIVTVDDTAFAPALINAQNLSTVTLTLTNTGTKPHDFTIDCLATPNDSGCPTKSCFTGATIGALAPGESSTIKFMTPRPEGLYVFRSDLPGDTQTGQFNVQ